jgi:hypothetical protein
MQLSSRSAIHLIGGIIMVLFSANNALSATYYHFINTYTHRMYYQDHIPVSIVELNTPRHEILTWGDYNEDSVLSDNELLVVNYTPLLLHGNDRSASHSRYKFLLYWKLEIISRNS